MPEVKTILTARDETATAFESMVDRGEAAVAQLDEAFVGLGEAMEATFIGISVAAFAEKLIGVTEKIEEIEKAAVKAGVSVTAFQELAYAASQTGVNIDDLSKGFKFLNKSLGEAEAGSQGAADKFAALGINFKDLVGLAPDKQMEIVGEAIMRLDDAALQGAAGAGVLGKAFSNLKPLFEDGAEGIEQLRQKAIETGKILSPDMVDQASAAARSIKDLKSSWDALLNTIAAKAAPALSATSNFFNSMIGGDSQYDQLLQRRTSIQEALDNSQNSSPDWIKGYADQLALVDAQLAKIRGDAGQGAAQIKKAIDDIIGVVVSAPAWSQKDQKAWLDTILPDIPKEQVDRLKQTGSAIERFYEQLNHLTETDTEKSADGIRKIQAALKELADSGQISPEEFQKRWTESLDKVLHDVEVSGKKLALPQKILPQNDQAGQEFARDLQQDFSSLFIDPSAKNLKSLARNFGNQMLQIFAELAAKNVIKNIFSGGDGSSWFSGLIGAGAVAGFAEGGDPPVDRASLVGERGPELFIPKTAGTVVPNDKLGGTNVIYQTVHQYLSGLGMSLEQTQGLLLRNNRALVEALSNPRLRS